MKKLAFVILLISFSLNAQNPNREWRQGNKDGVIKTYNDLQDSGLIVFAEILKLAVSQKVSVFSDDSNLEQFNNSLNSISLYINLAKTEPNVDRNANDNVKVLATELQNVEKIRRRLVVAINFAYVYKFPSRTKIWRQAIKNLNYLEYSKLFSDFDRAFLKFSINCNEIAKNKATDVSGAEVAMLSGLDKFTNNKGNTNPDFDRKLRTIDNYLFATRNEILNDFKQGLKEFNNNLIEVEKALKYLKPRFDKEIKLKIEPRNRIYIESIYQNLEILINDGFEFVKQVEELFKTVEDNSTEIGKLRNLSGFNNNGAFNVYGYPFKDGTQNYTDRVRFALDNRRNLYNEVMKHLGVNNPQW